MNCKKVKALKKIGLSNQTLTSLKKDTGELKMYGVLKANLIIQRFQQKIFSRGNKEGNIAVSS